MPVIAKETEGGDYTPAPQGTHLAVCNMVADLGLQETAYMGETKVKHQVYIRWELPNERTAYTDADGKEHEGPMVVGKTYTLSLHEKANLRQDLEGWRGKAFTADELKGFDLLKLLGVCCQVTITHKERENGKVYANVTHVAGWPKGMNKIEPENAVLHYDAEDTAHFTHLPRWLQDKINNQKQSTDPETDDPGPVNEDDYGSDPDDDIPF